MILPKAVTSKAVLASTGALSITLVFGIVLNRFPEWSENLYYNGIYRYFRKTWDFIFAWNPIPMFYIWLSFVLILIMIFLRNFFFKKGQKLACVKVSIVFLAFHFAWFYWSWGFNYSRIPLGFRWGINSPIQDTVFLNEFYRQTYFIDSLRRANKSEIDLYDLRPLELENQLRKLVSDFQIKHGFPVFNQVRCRNLHTHGILLIWSTSGVYLPFVGESQFDGGLHKLSKPFTMAHELAHGMGWTHEGDCNFIAYLACRSSLDPFIRYSAELNYWRYLYANASRTHPNDFKVIKSKLDPAISNDLKEINEANDRYPELFPHLRTWFYDWYLKNNGISSGDKSYSEMIRMVVNYKKLRE